MNIIGLEKGTVRLEPHHPDWKRLFEAEKGRLQKAVGKHVCDIQHVGSTAIPGIPAKPIIDIGIGVDNFEEASICVEPIKALGYDYRGECGIPRRHFFVRGEPRLFHIHMLEINGEEWDKHLLFRDYLVQHPEIAREYAKVKTGLAAEFANERENYTDGKAPFILEILKIAQKNPKSGLREN